MVNVKLFTLHCYVLYAHPIISASCYQVLLSNLLPVNTSDSQCVSSQDGDAVQIEFSIAV